MTEPLAVNINEAWTDTPDWADNEAEIITRDMIYSNYGQKDIDRIAAALRSCLHPRRR